MSERLSQPSPERHIENIEFSVETEKRNDQSDNKAENKPDLSETIDNVRAQVENEAVSGKETTIGEKQENTVSPIGLQRELKETAYKQSLQRIQSQLKAPQRLFSKTIHNPSIERLSNVAGRTVARPSGILAGGFLALLGSNVLLYLAKHYGFKYNYLAFFLLFIGGFIAGLILEGLFRIARRKRTEY